MATAENSTEQIGALLPSGTRVRTTALNQEKAHEWTKEGLDRKKWGMRGAVVSDNSSHGLAYEVLHEDGTTGWYDPSELEVIAD